MAKTSTTAAVLPVEDAPQDLIRGIVAIVLSR